MPANKSALLRYRIIDKCLRNKYQPYPTKEELRQKCEDELFNSVGERVSTSTIEKDINAMRHDMALGYEAPIRFSKEHKGYFYEDPNYSIDTIPLNQDDLQAIRFAAQTLHQFKGVKIFEEFDFAIGKIFDRINLSNELDDQAVNKFVQFESVTASPGTEHLPVLLGSIKERFVTEVFYEPFGPKQEKKHLLHPYLLKEYRNRWYLVAYDTGAGKIKTFGLDRITELTQTKKTFKRPDFDPGKFFKYSIGITAYDKEPEEVVLSFDPSQKHYLVTQPLHQSQKVITDAKNEFRIQLTVLPSIELEMLLLGFGDKVKVEQPESLADKIAKSIAAAQEQY